MIRSTMQARSRVYAPKTRQADTCRVFCCSTQPGALMIHVYPEGDGFVAESLVVDVASEGATAEDARANLREALDLYFDETGSGT